MIFVLSALRQRAVDVKPDELRALGLAFVFNFIVLGSYYVLRPIRDDIGAAGDIENLFWMYTDTMVVMILANVLFSALVAKRSRRQFIPIAYRFFIANLILALPARIQPTVVSIKQPHENEFDRTYRVVLRKLRSHLRELGTR